MAQNDTLSFAEILSDFQNLKNKVDEFEKKVEEKVEKKVEKQVEEKVQRKLKEDMSQALQCPICFEIPSSANPSMILCGNGHKACRDCLQGLQSSVHRKCWAKCDFLAAFVKDLATMTMIDALNLNHLGQPPVQVQAPPPATAEQVEVSAVQDSTPIFEVDDEAPFAPTSPAYSPTSPTYGTMPQISQDPADPEPAPTFRPAVPRRIANEDLTEAQSQGRIKRQIEACKKAANLHETRRSNGFSTATVRSAHRSAMIKFNKLRESLRLHASKFGQLFVPPRMANSQRLQEFNNMSRPYVSSDIFARNGFTWAIGV